MAKSFCFINTIEGNPDYRYAVNGKEIAEFVLLDGNNRRVKCVLWEPTNEQHKMLDHAVEQNLMVVVNGYYPPPRIWKDRDGKTIKSFQLVVKKLEVKE